MKILKFKLKQGTLQEIYQEAKWITQYTKKYYLAIIYYIFLGILSTGMGLATSISSKYLIDAVTGYDSTNIGFIIVVILSMAFGNIIIRAATSRVSTRISLNVNNEIQADIYDKIMNTDWESMSEYHSGDLLNRVNGDVKIVADSVLGWIPSLITKLVQFIGTLAVILYYDSTMAIIALLSAPVSMIMSRMLMTRMREYNKKMRQVSSDMMAFNEESFQNIQTIKCFDLINFFGQKLRNVQDIYANMALDYNKFFVYTSSFMSVIGIIVSYATFGWGIYRLWGGFITYGTMTLFLQLSSSLSGGFSALVGMVPSAIGATTSAGRIMAIVELPREKVEHNIIDNKTDNKTDNKADNKTDNKADNKTDNKTDNIVENTVDKIESNTENKLEDNKIVHKSEGKNIDKKPESKSVNFIEQNPKMQGLTLQLSHLGFLYKGRFLVLKDVAFYAKPREIVAIIGPSGKGKTTLLRILLGLLNPSVGDAKLIDEYGQETRISAATRKFFSYVPQGNTIFSGTIADNLRMVRPEATDEELIDALNAACAYDFVKVLPEGIYAKVGEKGGGFSEGQAQRLSIARAVLRDAPILLLDEATSALDADTERNVLKSIMAYGKTHTCILTTHRTSVLELCDRVYQINDTQVTEICEDHFKRIAVDF